ncbi:MAG: transcriptional regulator [Archangium sp.]|nr:transcriptional regulator [Archangium sp.]
MAEPVTASTLSLSVGDRVVYPNQGLCTVTDIKSEEIAGQKLVFVSLTIIETGAKVKAPQEKLARIGIRRLSSPDEVKRVIDYLRADSEKASLDWKKRARDNTLRLSEGGLQGLAEVVKGLQVLSELRPLPPKERELYNDARHLFVTELAAASGMPECDAEDTLDVILFPIGKERPKRTIEEFKALAGDDDLLGDDLLGLDGSEGAVDGAEGAAPSEDSEADGESSDDSGDDDAPAKPVKAKAPAKEKAPKAAAAPKEPKEKKAPAEKKAKPEKADKVAKPAKAAKPPKEKKPAKKPADADAKGKNKGKAKSKA